METSIEKQNKLIVDIAALEKNLRKARAELHEASQSSNKSSEEILTKIHADRRKAKYTTSNGLSIHALRQAGCKVRVHHVRYLKLPSKLVSFGIPNNPNITPVPSFHADSAHFHPNGGSTYISILGPDGAEFNVTSYCHLHDNFDRKFGIKLALDQISITDARSLLDSPKVETVVEPAATCSA